MSSNSKKNKSGGWIFPVLAFCLLTGNLPIFVIMIIIYSMIMVRTPNKGSRTAVRNQNRNPRILHSDTLSEQSRDTANDPQYHTESVPNLGLPKQAAKRHKMLSRFNHAYGLNLTSEQIQRIVDASYMSVEWTKELVAMSAEYENTSSWYVGEHAWLRAYLKAFQVQNISSDFTMQEQIVFDSFDRVFADICNDPSQPMERAISRINTKYPILFDEATFTIAYRFLESKGKKYPVSFTQIFSMDDGIDDLLSKYSKGDTTPAGTLQRR